MAHVKSYNHVTTILVDCWIFQLHVTHGVEGSVQALTNIFIWRIRELIDESHQNAVSSEALFKDIFGRYVGWQRSGASYLYAIVEDLDMYIICHAVISMKDSISDDLVQRRVGICDLL